MSSKLARRYSTDFVIRVNEIYHDVEGGLYEESHPEIFEHEKPHLEAIAKSFMKCASRPVSILDIGCGTGFVPLAIGPFLKKTDRVFCADVSSEMLDVCERNLREADFGFETSFIKLDGKTIPLASGSFDFVTMNSTLHHVPDTRGLFAEINRLLKKNGFLVIGHEANRKFFKNTLLLCNYRFLLFFFDLKGVVFELLVRTGLKRLGRKAYRAIFKTRLEEDPVVKKVNEVLIKEGLLDSPLEGYEISAIVDIHSPTAGAGIEREKGFDVEDLLREYLADFKTELFETYFFLERLSYKNSLLRAYERFLGKRFAGRGSRFIAVFKKLSD